MPILYQIIIKKIVPKKAIIPFSNLKRQSKMFIFLLFNFLGAVDSNLIAITNNIIYISWKEAQT